MLPSLAAHAALPSVLDFTPWSALAVKLVKIPTTSSHGSSPADVLLAPQQKIPRSRA